MTRIFTNSCFRRPRGLAVLCTIGLTFLLPTMASAHTLLLHSSVSSTGTLDGPALFNLLAVTLVELGAIFWVGAQFWVNFVLQPAAEKHQEERDLNAQVEQRFERRFSLPTLVLLLLASFGVLYSHALTRTENDWGAAFNWQVLSAQTTAGSFGTYWLLRMGVLVLALLVGLYMVLSKQRPRAVNQTLPLLNLFLGAVLFLALTMSGDAIAVNGVILPYSVVIDWLHLMAAALWIGSMFYILLVYLPALKPRSLNERARSLLTMLPQYSPLAITGVVLMAATGPLSASFHLTSLNQFATTAYGRTLLIKILLVGVLLATSAYHLFWLRPRLKKEEQKYLYTRERLAKLQASAGNNAAQISAENAPAIAAQVSVENDGVGTETLVAEGQPKSNQLLVQQVKLREGRLAKKTDLMTRVLRWEPWLGVAVIVCVGLMNVFAGGLALANAQTSGQPNTVVAGPFNGSAPTSDGKYNVTLSVSPNTFGTNVFTVQVTNAATGKPLGANEVSVSVDTTMLDMDMGTDSTSLTPNGKGGFSASGDLSMGGNWDIKVLLRIPDSTLHTANFKFYTPF